MRPPWMVFYCPCFRSFAKLLKNSLQTGTGNRIGKTKRVPDGPRQYDRDLIDIFCNAPDKSHKDQVAEKIFKTLVEH